MHDEDKINHEQLDGFFEALIALCEVHGFAIAGLDAAETRFPPSMPPEVSIRLVQLTPRTTRANLRRMAEHES